MTDQEIRLKFGEMNAGEMRLARALVEWHEREITKLKEDLTHAERWRDKLDTKLTEVVEAADRAGWDGVENSKNLPTFITYLAEALSKAQAELAALRQPILADDGRSLGQVAYDKYTEYARLRSHQQCLELVAQKVADVVLAQAVWRIEKVPVDEIGWIVWELRMVQGLSSDKTAEAVRARLIAAVKGEGQTKEIPQAEAEPAQAWTPAVGDVVRLKSGGPSMTVTHVDPLSLMCAWMNANNELQVEPITTLCLEPAQP